MGFMPNTDEKNAVAPREVIHIEGARQHNLKNLTLDIPRNELVVICGPSGSGKSTLAFDLVYAEGQRRYVESLSAYARQFLPQMDKPDVDKIEGLTPAISLEQQTATRNPRSTVGTVTEVYDFLRVFFARLGTMHCPRCGEAIEARSTDEIINDILTLGDGSRCMILAPLAVMQKGTHQDRFKKLKAEGFARVRVNGEICSLDDAPALDKNKKHNIELVVDRLTIREGIRGRLADSVELALKYGGGDLIALVPGENKTPDRTFIHSTSATCAECKLGLPKMTPQLFSFNGPQGACQRCLGLGTVEYFDPALIAPNRGLSLSSGALLPWKNPRVYQRYKAELEAFAQRFNLGLSSPLSDYGEEALRALFHGESAPGVAAQATEGSLRRNWLGGTVQARGGKSGGDGTLWPGVITLLEKGLQYGDAWRDELSRYRHNTACPECAGARLNETARAVRVDGLSIVEFCALPVARALKWLSARSFSGRKTRVANPLLKELNHRLHFMVQVGLDYISLSRAMSTLSGGEAQRIRLASQLGSGLVGVTYVLDEPSIGLHPRDNVRLLDSLRDLQQRGNTVLVVEHDEPTIRSADTVMELGPGSGEKGGEIVFCGTVPQLLQNKNSLTAGYLRKDLRIPRPEKRRSPKREIVLKKVSTNNLRNIDCRIPLGVLTCVSGVSGSGKSSLVVDTLYKHIALHKGLKVENPGSIGGISGIEAVERITAIDQTPIGRTPRSNPATYTKVFDEIRAIFASSQDAKKRGYNPGRFSFNVKGGRCEACGGDGQIRVEMHFLPDIFVQCDVCGGKRYNHETLEVRYKGLNIAEVLELTVQQARDFFENYQGLNRKLSMLAEVGLEYLRLGQPAPTLSGGEAQRIKISRELGKRSLPGALYVLDEPTTGLHMHEVGKLISVLHELVERGATVVVIEHNADMISCADYVIDLGPGGGENGGLVISSGTPEEISQDPNSVTGAFLSLI
ncbi:MAG: excinuclease ABC subunit UvrA [Desulfovibrio sp.]|jgi:excinuclease ABC subunit A|nr:excinuclease ABC subunit UvrA [Desulfovibrio sp.]